MDSNVILSMAAKRQVALLTKIVHLIELVAMGFASIRVHFPMLVVAMPSAMLGTTRLSVPVHPDISATLRPGVPKTKMTACPIPVVEMPFAQTLSAPLSADVRLGARVIRPDKEAAAHVQRLLWTDAKLRSAVQMQNVSLPKE